MWSNLMMAVLSSIVPGFGLLGSIVEFISSDDPNSGKRFWVELGTINLPGGFITSLATNIATELFLGEDVSTAAKKVTPYHELLIKCAICGNYSHYYLKKAGQVCCSSCLSDSIGSKVKWNDKIYIHKNGVYQVHNQVLEANKKCGEILYGRKLPGRSL